MSFNSERSLRRTLVFDTEAAPILNAADYLEPVSAPSNYTKPEAIANYVAKAEAEQLAKCALDPDLARIVALGLIVDGEVTVDTAKDEGQERALLAAFWFMLGDYPYPRLIGFNCLGYDLPLIYRRSLYLGVTPKPIAMGKYKHPDVDDLMMVLSFDGAQKFHSLDFYCKRFNLDVPTDPVKGKDIGALVAANDWEAIAHHCRCDVIRTAMLGARMGYCHVSQTEAVL